MNLVSPAFAGLVASLATNAVLAQGPTGAVTLDRNAVDRWVDGQVESALKTSGIPGALVVVVQRSGVVLNKAYGLSNVAAGTRADPEATLLEYASIGKTMTAAIAAQLIDEGVLDPDQDVNYYLKTAGVSGSAWCRARWLSPRSGGSGCTSAGWSWCGAAFAISGAAKAPADGSAPPTGS